MKQDDLLTYWVRKYTKELLSWAVYKVSDRATAEDLVQDIFLVAAENQDKFRNESNVKTWLFGILNIKIAEYYRSKSKFNKIDLGSDKTLDEFFDEKGNWRKEEIASEWENADEHLFDNQDFIKSFQSCLENLPKDWNRCISLKFLEEKDTTLVCQELGISPTNYWQIVHRAKLQLRKCLEKKWFRKNRK